MQKGKNIKNVPNLRFPGFEGEWERKQLGEVCEIKTGNKDTNNKDEDGLYPFFVRSNTVERINTYSYNGEAILTSGDGVGVGKNFHYINGKFDFHQRVYALRNFDKKYSGKFIYSVFSHKFYDRVKRLSAKNSVDSVRMDMISDMYVFFPNLNEQDKITCFLSLIDKRIETQSKIIEQLQTLILNLRNQIFKQLVRFKDEMGKEFPDWAEVKIGNILKICNGKDYKHLRSGKVPVFGTGGFMTSVDGFLHDGETVCIGRKGTIDKPMYHKGKIWTVDTLFYTHSFQLCTPKFVFHLFQTINWLEYNEASGVPSLSKTTIEKIKIQIPSVEEQHQIASFLSKIDKKIQMEAAVLGHLKIQKKYFLHEMLV